MRMLHSFRRIAAVAICGWLGLSAAACGGSVSSSTPATLTVAETHAPTSLDPQGSDQIANNAALALSYQCLMQASPTGALEPALATGYTLSADRKSYTFNLRKDVHFTNGQTLTSADVVFSYKRLFKTGSPTLKSVYSNFTGDVAADGPDKVVFNLSAPNAGFPLLMANPTVDSCAILSEKAANAGGLATHMVGTGPWEQVAYTPDVSLTMKRFAGYWGTKTATENLKMLFVPNTSTQVADFNAGTVDLIQPPQSSVAGLHQQHGVVVKKVPTANITVLEFNTAAAPFDNVDVRRAVAVALDRDALVKVSYGGAATPTSYIPPGYSWATPLSSLPYSSHDLAQAKSLLAKAGHPNGVTGTLQYITDYDFGTNAMMAQVQSQLAAAGIHVRLVPEQVAQWIANSETSYAHFTLGWNAVPYQANPATYVQVFGFEYGPGKGQVPAALQTLTDTALNAPNTGEFQTAINAIEKWEDDNVYPRLELIALDNFVAYKTSVRHVDVPLSGSTSFLAAVIKG